MTLMCFTIARKESRYNDFRYNENRLYRQVGLLNQFAEQGGRLTFSFLSLALVRAAAV